MPRLPDHQAGHAARAIKEHNINPQAVGSKKQIPCPVCSVERVKSTATPCGTWVADVGRVNFVCQHCDMQGFVDVGDRTGPSGRTASESDTAKAQRNMSDQSDCPIPFTGTSRCNAGWQSDVSVKPCDCSLG